MPGKQFGAPTVLARGEWSDGLAWELLEPAITVLLEFDPREAGPGRAGPEGSSPEETSPSRRARFARAAAAQTTAAETTTAQTTTAETSPAEATTVETTTVETTAAQTTPGDASPAETTTAETTPAQTKSAETTAAQTMPGEVSPAETSPAEASLWEQAREITAAIEALELQRTEVLRALVAEQTASDLEHQRRLETAGAPAVALAAGRRRSAAQIEADAQTCVVDTATLTFGGTRTGWLLRVRFASAATELTAPIQAAITDSALAFEQGCTLVRDTDDLDLTGEQRQAVVDAVVAHARARAAATGAPVGQGLFRAAMRREIGRHTDRGTRRARSLAQRTTWVCSDSDGVATFGVSGADARCLGAQRRVDAIARAIKSDGDDRTLAQLRSDVALDLLLFGQPAADAPTSVDHPGDVGWPAAVVDVVISAASLLGVTDEPGLVDGTPVAADVVRDLATRAGNVWRRIVADPVTGYAMATVVDSIRIPADMARAVRARDGICRAPGCNRPAEYLDLDHVIERRDGGLHCGENLQGLCRLHHSKKTRRHWSAHIRPDGTVTWLLPDGREYVTFPMDYRDLDPTLGAGAPAPPRAPDPDDPAPPRAPDPDDPAPPRAPDPDDPAPPDGESPQAHCPPTIEPDDLVDLRLRALALAREVGRLRAQLRRERDQHGRETAELLTYRAEHPPF